LKLVHETMQGNHDTLSLDKSWEEYSDVERLLILLRPLELTEQRKHADPRFSINDALMPALLSSSRADSYCSSMPPHSAAEEQRAGTAVAPVSSPLRTPPVSPFAALQRFGKTAFHSRRSARSSSPPPSPVPSMAAVASVPGESAALAPECASTPASECYQHLFSAQTSFVPGESAAFLPGMRGSTVQQHIDVAPNVLQLGNNSLRCVISSAHVLWLQEGCDPLPVLLTLFNDLFLITSPLRRSVSGQYMATFLNAVILSRLQWFDLPDWQCGRWSTTRANCPGLCAFTVLLVLASVLCSLVELLRERILEFSRMNSFSLSLLIPLSLS
jgi:hypothetical protein